MKTFKEIRLSFWENHPQFKSEYKKTYKQNQYKTDIRVLFCGYIDHLQKDGIISESVANRITL